MSTNQEKLTPKAKTQERPRRSTGRISQATENYLLSLSILREDGIAPHISQLAEYLRQIPAEEGVGTTLASVSGMVHRMARENLVTVNKEKRVLLTAEGQTLANHVVRRHRLSERLLVNVLGVPLERAETEAHRLEHGISPALLEHIERKLEYPDTCPYGRPIYRSWETESRPELTGVIPLSAATAGIEYVVIRIPDETYSLLRFLVANKVLPGQRLIVAEVAPYRGVVDLERNGEQVSVGMEVATRVRVRPSSNN